MPSPPDLSALAARTQEVYERHGHRYDAERGKHLFEQPWLSRFASYLPPQAAILDVGCGAGEPIARYFLQNGHQLTGIDFASSMIELARQRFPASQWQVADMRSFDLGQQFHGLIAWHSFFHLMPAEQPYTLARFAAHLHPGGAMLLTVGPAAGEVVGQVADEAVYHSSLSLDAYRQVLASLGMRVLSFVAEDPQCGDASVLLAQKR